MDRKRSRVSILATVITSVALSGCVMLPQEEAELIPPIIEAQKIEYKTVKAEIGKIEKIITAKASAVSERQAGLSFTYRGGFINAIHIKEGDFVKKGQVLAELDNEAIESQIKRQKIMVKKAQINLSESYKTKQYAVYTNAQLDLELAKLTLSELQTELQKSQITAPFDGKIISLSNYMVGEQIAARSILCVIADPDNLRVVCSDDSMGRFGLNDEVVVTYGKKEYKGRVVMTPTAALKVKEQDEELEQALKSKIVIKFKQLPEEFALGSDVTVKLLVSKDDNAVLVPTNAIKIYGGKKYLLVWEDNTKVERLVETGIENATQTQIITGVEAGEEVIIN